VGGFIGTEMRATQADPNNNLTVVSADPGGDTLTGDIVANAADKLGNNNLPRLFNASGLGTANDDLVIISGLVINAAGNNSPVNGSGVTVDNSYVRLVSSQLVANSSQSGAVNANNGAKLELFGVRASGNAADNGAVVYVSGASTELNVLNSVFDTNTAGTAGAVYIDGGTASFDKVEFSNNSAATGAALMVNNASSNVNLEKNRF
jgi:hypothetical protein